MKTSNESSKCDVPFYSYSFQAYLVYDIPLNPVLRLVHDIFNKKRLLPELKDHVLIGYFYYISIIWIFDPLFRAALFILQNSLQKT